MRVSNHKKTLWKYSSLTSGVTKHTLCLGSSIGAMLNVPKESDLEIPEIFRGAIDYREDPWAFELAQKTFNEDGLYRAIASFALDWYRSTSRPAKILDLCSSTGLCALRVARMIPVESVTLIDIDQSVLTIGCKTFDKICPIFTYCADAVTFQSGKPYDLILMNSAYHHIKDNRKVDFLKNAASLLADGGVILIGEHFLPPYNNSNEYRESVVVFYTNLIKELESKGESAELINVIRKCGMYCWERIYEYKVCSRIFHSHMRRAGLKATEFHEVWLHSEGASALESIGTYCFNVTRDKSNSVSRAKNISTIIGEPILDRATKPTGVRYESCPFI